MAFVIRGDYRCKTPLRCKIRNPHRILVKNAHGAHTSKKNLVCSILKFFLAQLHSLHIAGEHCLTTQQKNMHWASLDARNCLFISLYKLETHTEHPGGELSALLKTTSAGLQFLPSVINAVEKKQLFVLLFVFLSNSDAFVFTGPHLMLCPPPLCLFYLLSQMVRLTDFHFRCHIFKATHGAIFLTNTWPRSLWRHYLYHSHSHVSESTFNLKFSKALIVRQKTDEPHVVP